jgi:hypothetical protein
MHVTAVACQAPSHSTWTAVAQGHRGLGLSTQVSLSHTSMQPSFETRIG